MKDARATKSQQVRMASVLQKLATQRELPDDVEAATHGQSEKERQR